MSPTLTTFLFEAANFLVLAIVLGWLFFKPVRQALADQKVKFAAESEQAAQKLADAEKTQQEMETARALLQTELHDLRARELTTAGQQAEQILTEARGAAERERELSRRQAARMSETQRDRLAEAAVTAAADTVGHLFAQIDGPELQTALINAACRQIASLPRDNLAPIKIESAEPLSEEQQAALKTAIGVSAESVDFRTQGGLGAGVRIETRAGLIDATARGLTQFARQSLLAEVSRLGNHHSLSRDTEDA